MAQILVIDDDPTTQIILKKILRDQGHNVAIASNGLEGIRQARELHPSLIICDWLMPLIDGLEVCRQLKTDPDLASIFFILLTSRGAIEDRVHGLDNGADDFLSKPVDLSELKARVGQACVCSKQLKTCRPRKTCWKLPLVKQQRMCDRSCQRL
jgi:sigma-B regulation protein RsbU (phosphoserine phosphatase)